jgi:hypothetical protein
MNMQFKCALFAALWSALAFGQAPAAPQKTTDLVAAPVSNATSLSQDQIRQLIRESADHDMANDKK